ncbi:hypothetical protein A4E84_19605 [Streptomyces qaidamensis]|uniref:Uncharacterized protein n=1 Tax=Streptomyces qaidamensis TaxID=1783515 RepID=A0A143C261_9ACTN|nr:hypothetical protein [Streptomyces qaidamensis]AMW11504.1 hypothetical protein A4E84_19605 [Streptomyces qaidamensis]
MTNTKARTAALITPVGREAQDEARALAAGGRTGKAVRRLRRGSWLKRGPAREAVELLAAGHALPTDNAEGLAALRRLDAELVAELTALLDDDQQIAAVKLLRERTGVDLAGGYHLVLELGGRPAAD